MYQIAASAAVQLEVSLERWQQSCHTHVKRDRRVARGLFGDVLRDKIVARSESESELEL